MVKFIPLFILYTSAFIMLLEKPTRSESFQASLPALLSEYFAKRRSLVSVISLSSTASLLVILVSRLSISVCFSVIFDSVRLTGLFLGHISLVFGFGLLALGLAFLFFQPLLLLLLLLEDEVVSLQVIQSGF